MIGVADLIRSRTRLLRNEREGKIEDIHRAFRLIIFPSCPHDRERTRAHICSLVFFRLCGSVCFPTSVPFPSPPPPLRLPFPLKRHPGKDSCSDALRQRIKRERGGGRREEVYVKTTQKIGLSACPLPPTDP